MDFGQTLVALRTEKGIYQKELADYLDVSIGTISNYEKGVHSPDLETLCKLADYFEVSTDYLLQRTTFRYDPENLNKQLSMDYTIADIINTTLELTPRNLHSLMDFVELLRIRNSKDKGEKDKDDTELN